jgi:hypothetical protein
VFEQKKIKLRHKQNFVKNKTQIMQHILKCSKYVFTYAKVGHLRVKVPKKGYKLHYDQVSHTQCAHVGYVYGSQ